MLHIALHFLVPLLLAWVCYRARWKTALLILLATMVVDVDHLLADPIYDPNRCSIGFHPLHTVPAIIGYAILFVGAAMGVRKLEETRHQEAAWVLHLIGLGLLIHMALDGIDCL